MARQFKENSAAKNGSTKRQTRINTDVSKVVRELETRPNGKIDEPKVEVQFTVAVRDAKSVSVAGTFNDWNPKKTPLKKNGDAWDTTVALPRGHYEYRFIVDGQWMADPNAAEAVPNPFGSSNSVLNI
jgi:1,4-alpha-glucan branching enzyme